MRGGVGLDGGIPWARGDGGLLLSELLGRLCWALDSHSVLCAEVFCWNYAVITSETQRRSCESCNARSLQYELPPAPECDACR